MTCFSLLCRTCELPQLQMFVSNSFEAALELSLGSGLAEVCVVGGGGGEVPAALVPEGSASCSGILLVGVPAGPIPLLPCANDLL